ncbi:MAG: phenylalanine--tRNA ligase subunit alpha [Acidobacteriaceae bacterium]
MPKIDIPHLKDYSSLSLDGFFQAIQDSFEQEAAEVQTLDELEDLRIRWVGRKQGLINQVGDVLKHSPAEARKDVGRRFNALKAEIEPRCDPNAIRASMNTAAREFDSATARAKTAIAKGLTGFGIDYAAIEQARQAPHAIDITLPGIRPTHGAEHPLIRTMQEIVRVFEHMGYSVGVGPEVETDYYNFEALNFPPNHPARDTQDTLVVASQQHKPLRDRLLLRTHTSPVQIRTMERTPPPIRIVIPGKVHRNDAADATHSPIFHQVEGLCVDENITFSDLKGTLDHAMKELFGSNVRTRFFPSFFPFTEPSADVQISCIFCGGKGCRKCKHSGWIELLGCGMVNPAVFEFVRGKQPAYDPKKISGFAFGMGVDRIAMMKYGISDIGLLYSGDMRFLEQFA